MGTQDEVRAPFPPGGDGRRRLELRLEGSLQGVGFRPYVYRLANEVGLSGFVSNSRQGVTLEVEGTPIALTSFLKRFPEELPPLSRLDASLAAEVPLRNEEGFRILESDLSGPATAVLLPDAAVCPDCLREVLDPQDRRHRYPFTNCTHCGPRYSILLGLPYDRERTTLRTFPMCRQCRAEYEDPRSRRFHAQPTACPECGPQLAFWDAKGRVTERRGEALREAAWGLKAGLVLALKGLGGFQLLCDARDPEAVAKLRLRKRREEKPFAVMFKDLDSIRRECLVSGQEEEILRSPAGPIVLLRRRRDGEGSPDVARGVAPSNPLLGCFLPTTPLHALLLSDLGFPLVATSGNLTDEPICIAEEEALGRLGSVADAFLVHDRPIARSVDDSVVRVAAGRLLVLRRARGYAPRSVVLPSPAAGEGPVILAVGGQMKGSVAVLRGNRVFLSQHLGDLETPRALEAFRCAAGDLPRLLEVEPSAVACDAHPDYASTKYAESLSLPLAKVQHHEAHAAACAAENGVVKEALAVIWDGTGWGPDGTVWGGEFFTGRGGTWRRRGRLRPFRLPGGEAAVREPRRCALGVLYELGGEGVLQQDHLPCVSAFSGEEKRVLLKMLEGGVQSPWTSSAGRLFDAAAALLGLHQKIRFEGQAAMALEYEAGEEEAAPYGVSWAEGPAGLLEMDWGPMILGMLHDLEEKVKTPEISGKFHSALVEGVIKGAELFGHNTVLLGGGCFQNKRLLEGCVRRLESAGLEVHWPREVPPNDGGLALGQAVAARERLLPPVGGTEPVRSNPTGRA